MKPPFHLWVVCDGKPGHENQSLGLADAIGRRVSTEIHRISLAGNRGFASKLRAALDAARTLPKPSLVLSAGHSTHPSLLLLARKSNAPCIVLMKPSLPLGWFDLCIAPEHDFPDGTDRRDILLTRGALHRVTPGDGERKGKLILVGGPSKTHGWDAAGLIEMLAPATDRGGWQLSDSRRTPADFLEMAREKLPGVEIISHHDTPPGWVPRTLAAAKEVWVTEDSVSMVYEALGSGARVGLLPVPRRDHESRVLRGIDSLVDSGFVTPYSKWRQTQRIEAPPSLLNEADRCAEIVVARFLSGGGNAA
ncbi:MAG: mitochondrial fission ELM1 family protein [Verrucomicrobiae bacterium]|nr:mitochondrial fission ELM1 family protein [Verrucomicrobiae bacterium]